MYIIRILVAKATIVKIDGLNKWKLGNNIIGSWTGPNPKGCVFIRSGYLDLFTGEYTIARPLTTVFE